MRGRARGGLRTRARRVGKRAETVCLWFSGRTSDPWRRARFVGALSLRPPPTTAQLCRIAGKALASELQVFYAELSWCVHVFPRNDSAVKLPHVFLVLL